MPEPKLKEDSARLALSSYVKLMRAADSATARIHRHLQQVGLSVTQFGVLEALYHLGPLCQRDLGRKLLKSSGNMTLVIENLEKGGLVVRRRDEADRRYWVVELSSAGQALLEEVFPRHVAAVVAEFATLSSAEQRDLARICRKLGRRDQEGPASPAQENKP